MAEETPWQARRKGQLKLDSDEGDAPIKIGSRDPKPAPTVETVTKKRSKKKKRKLFQ